MGLKNKIFNRQVNSFFRRPIAEKLLLDVQDAIFLQSDPDRVLPRWRQDPRVQVVQPGGIGGAGITAVVSRHEGAV